MIALSITFYLVGCYFAFKTTMKMVVEEDEKGKYITYSNIFPLIFLTLISWMSVLTHRINDSDTKIRW